MLSNQKYIQTYLNMIVYVYKRRVFMNIKNITNYKLKDFAELLGVSVKTLQRWDRDGIFVLLLIEDIIRMISIYSLEKYRQRII